MDENTFRAPEPEDHGLPEAPASPDREDNELPASDHIGKASAMFHFSGGDAPETDPDEILARDFRSPAYTRRESEDDPAPSPAPMTSLAPENVRRSSHENKRKKQWTLLACALGLLALAAGAVLYILVNGNPFLRENVSIGVPSVMPQSEQEIVAFYRVAVNAVKKDGLAGYRKKTWQSVSSLELTGVEFVDNLLGNVFHEYVTPENRAASVTFEKGTPEAKAQFPVFTVSDLSYVKSAACTRVGDIYQITIVFQHEDTPMEKDSFLGQATNAVVFWDSQIEPVLEEISQLHAWSDVHVDYVDMTITAEIGANGRFVSLKHFAPAEVTIGSARLGIFSFTDKSLHFESTASYTDFRY